MRLLGTRRKQREVDTFERTGRELLDPKFLFAEPDRLADRSLGGHDAQLAYGEVPFVKELERRLPYCAGRADYRDCLFARHRFDPIISTPALSRPRLYRENHRQSISFRRATASSPTWRPG